MGVIVANNASSVLVGDLTSTGASFDVADGSQFPELTGNDYSYITIEANGSIEIVKVNGRTGNTLSIEERGVDGTTALEWTDGATVEIRICSALLKDISVPANDDPVGKPYFVYGQNGFTWWKSIEGPILSESYFSEGLIKFDILNYDSDSGYTSDIDFGSTSIDGSVISISDIEEHAGKNATLLVSDGVLVSENVFEIKLKVDPIAYLNIEPSNTKWVSNDSSYSVSGAYDYSALQKVSSIDPDSRTGFAVASVPSGYFSEDMFSLRGNGAWAGGIMAERDFVLKVGYQNPEQKHLGVVLGSWTSPQWIGRTFFLSDESGLHNKIGRWKGQYASADNYISHDVSSEISDFVFYGSGSGYVEQHIFWMYSEMKAHMYINGEYTGYATLADEIDQFDWACWNHLSGGATITGIDIFLNDEKSMDPSIF